MDVKFINAFVESIQNVFSTMVHTDVSIGRPSLRSAQIASSEVSGVIGLSGDVQGSVVLSFSGDVACKVASKFAGVEMTMKSDDFCDAIGELANMVAGDAKKSCTGCNASISLPSVIVGPGHTVSQSKFSRYLVIPCTTDLGAFNVEIALTTGKESATSAPQLAGAAS